MVSASQRCTALHRSFCVSALCIFRLSLGAGHIFSGFTFTSDATTNIPTRSDATRAAHALSVCTRLPSLSFPQQMAPPQEWAPTRGVTAQQLSFHLSLSRSLSPLPPSFMFSFSFPSLFPTVFAVSGPG